MSLMKPLVLHLLKCKQFILHGIECVKYSNLTISSQQSQVCQNLLIKMRSICQKLGEKLLKYAIFLLLFKISSFLYHSNLPARALELKKTLTISRLNPCKNVSLSLSIQSGCQAYLCNTKFRKWQTVKWEMHLTNQLVAAGAFFVIERNSAHRPKATGTFHMGWLPWRRKRFHEFVMY